ncbi:MAG: sensor domain-containing diguanylate cyclase [Pseudomonadota bacterium]|nr:sensor domain-containing diguanylate cyclase [Pseudomonadota bacterium]
MQPDHGAGQARLRRGAADRRDAGAGADEPNRLDGAAERQQGRCGHVTGSADARRAPVRQPRQRRAGARADRLCVRPAENGAVRRNLGMARTAPGIRTSLAKLVVVCVLPLAAVAGLLIEQFYEQEHVRLTATATGRARSMVATVDRGFSTTQASLLALSTSKRLEQGDFAGFRLRAFEALQNMHADNIVVLDMAAQMLLATNRPFGAPLPKLSSAPLLARVIETERPAVSDLYNGPIIGIPIFSVGVPVEYAGKLKYLLAATTRPQQLTKILTEQNFPDSWRAALTDSTGTIVARTHGIERFLGKKVVPALLARINSEAEGSLIITTLDGIAVLTVYSKSPVTGWTIVIGMPLDEITGGLRRTLAWLIAATIAALGIGIASAWVIGGRIARSITLLGASASALGEGGQPAVATVHFREAIELGQVLLQAADNLRKAKHAAHHDGLTGLPNRALFSIDVSRQLALCKRNAGVLSILYIDLDGFKAVNDSFGHAAGDQLLCAVAQRITAAIRESDMAARLGGDEFAIALIHTSIEDAARFAEKLLAIVSAPYPLSEHAATISASIGIAAYPQSATEIDTLLGKADRAMYRAKHSGKRRCCIAGQAAGEMAGQIADQMARTDKV